MKILKNEYKTVFGVKKPFFSVVYDAQAKLFYYYINAILTQNDGDLFIYKGSEKSKIFNKYTMTFLGVIYSIYGYLIAMPISIILLPFSMYLEGAKNFIKDCAWYEHVRFFNYVNFIALIVLVLFLTFKTLTN